MYKLYVALGERSYPIYLDAGILHHPHLLTQHIQGQQVLIVTNDVIAPLYLAAVQAALQNYQCDVVMLPDGEQSKTWDSVNKVIDVLIEKRHRRHTTLLALGGGVIGDITGFAAACYQRGVNFIQLPTTLLAQVDSSVGGKTAINHARGKNMIGAFYQPSCVIIDINVLDSLPKREFSAGLAEIIKAALVYDANFYHWLEMNLPALLERNPALLLKAIEQACAIKAAIVSADEHDQDLRMLLNLGHTFGHAIEHVLGYGMWLHGEAVAVGLVIAADLSVRLGWLEQNALASICNILKAAQLPTRLPSQVAPEAILASMEGDKKNTDSRLRVILLKALGQAAITYIEDKELLLQLLRDNTGQR